MTVQYLLAELTMVWKIVAGLSILCAAFAVLCIHLWRRLHLLESKMRRAAVRLAGEIDQAGDRIDTLFARTAPTAREVDAEFDEIMGESLRDRAATMLPPPFTDDESEESEQATITPIGRAIEIRKTSTRVPGKPPQRSLSAPPKRRLERPGLRPQNARGPFSGKLPFNPFEDS